MSRVGLILVLGVFAAGIAWLVSAQVAPTVDPVRPPAERADPVSERPLHAPGLEGAEGDATPGAVADDVRESPDPLFTWRVNGSVTGLDHGEHAEARVTVRAVRGLGWMVDGTKPVDGPVAADDTFDVDVAEIIGSGKPIHHLRVDVDHPRYLVGTTTLEIVDFEAPPPVTLEADVVLEPAWVVTGRVVGADGEPVPMARTLLFAWDGVDVGRSPITGERQAVDRRAQTEAGRFRLRAPASGRHLLVVEDDDHVPVSRLLGLDRPSTDVGDVALEPGRSVSGRVTLNGVPAAGAQVEVVSPQKPARTLDVWGRKLTLHDDGRVSPGRGRAATGPDGTYEIVGLAGQPHVARVTAFAGARAWMGAFGRSQPLEAPAIGVDFDLRVVDLTVAVTTGGAPFSGARVVLGRKLDGRSTYTTFTTGEDGRVRVLLPPDVAFSCFVQHDDHEQVRVDLGALPPGAASRQVELGAPKATAVVVLTLTDAEGRPVKRIGYAFRDADDEHAPMTDNSQAESEAGVYRLEDVRPGRLRLHVTPGRGKWDFGTGYLVDLDVPVDAEVGHERTLSLVARHGGRLRIVCRDADGNATAARAEILDAEGAAVPVQFFTSDDDSAMVSVRSLGGGGFSDVDPPLPPGTYEIVVHHADRKARTQAVVKAGETTSVELALPR